jgi:hypothetical protein
MAITQIRGAQIRDREITSGKIALNAIIEELIANNAVTASKIADAALVGGRQFASTVDVDGKTFSGVATFTSPVTVAAGVVATDAVNKGQLDQAVSDLEDSVAALGNAFNYVGLVAGGASEGAPYDLATLDAAGKDAGDYYKVSTSGWFVVGAGTAFYANVGDGLVWNTLASVDKIDNTNSTCQGTASFIEVTGSADTGYVVDVAQAFKDRVTAAEAAIEQLDTDNGAALAAETAARIAADAVLTQAVADEAAARVAADAVLTQAVADEAAARDAADDVLTQAVADEATARAAADAVLTQAVADEATARAAADVVLTQAVADEATARAAADTAINTTVGSLSALETADKTSIVAAINELQSEIEATNPGTLFVRDKVGGTVTGAIDGTNKAFVLASSAVAHTLMVYLNGLLQEVGDDYTFVAGTSTFTFVDAPVVGDKVTVQYFAAN